MTAMMELAEQLGDVLKAKNLSFCAAESCTGGLITSTMTDIAGSSAYVLGGIVTYSNEAKQQFVHVREETLIAHGAVSAETAHEMAMGVRQVFDADLGVSVTGIAGPGGATPGKPVGLVYIGVATREEVHVARHIWDGDRIQNKELSTAQALRLALDTAQKL